MLSNFLIGIFASEPTIQVLRQALADGFCTIHWAATEAEFIAWVASNRHRIDCLVVEHTSDTHGLLTRLVEVKGLLPLLIFVRQPEAAGSKDAQVLASPQGDGLELKALRDAYHQAVNYADSSTLDALQASITNAVNQFLNLGSEEDTVKEPSLEPSKDGDTLHLQQKRLTEKLKERLGYLGVYYKRHPDNFLRNMAPSDRSEFIQQLQTEYRAIILSYFSDDKDINQKIDNFVNAAFFADISVSHIVEIHMTLMEEFSKQLKLEGRNEEILLDYRLTLIDVIAHLCEMYRRSIPRGV